ncbi:hypothetical protein GCM10011513_17390 [Franconibacter daqui]|nr:hypothetical protein GCM10011513_17390 [Franconibacter daqui]
MLTARLALNLSFHLYKRRFDKMYGAGAGGDGCDYGDFLFHALFLSCCVRGVANPKGSRRGEIAAAEGKSFTRGVKVGEGSDKALPGKGAF